MKYTFTVPGKAEGKARPRTFIQGGRVVTYSPDKGGYEARVRAAAHEAGVKLTYGPVSVVIGIQRQMPTSWPKKKRQLMYGKPCTGVPDVANILCAIHDGLSKWAYADDRQVWSTTISRLWGMVDETFIEIEERTVEDIPEALMGQFAGLVVKPQLELGGG